MSHHDQDQIPVAYPPPPTAYHQTAPAEGYPQGSYVMPPPPPPPPQPMGYPTNEGEQYAQHHPPIETTTKGDGFWKGCVAAICCCWVLDVCCC